MLSWLYTCLDRILFAIMGLVILSLKIFLRTSPSAFVFPTNNFVFVLCELLTSLLTSCISLFWLPSPAHIFAFSLFSPLQRLTISFRFLHLDPSSYTFIVCSLHHPEKPYSSFFTFYFATWLKSCQTELYQTSSVWRETVPAARERERGQGCSCQANEVIFRNFQNYSWRHFYFLKAIENNVVGFVNRKKRIY